MLEEVIGFFLIGAVIGIGAALIITMVCKVIDSFTE